MGLRWFKFRGGSCICCWGAGLWSGIGGYWNGWGTSWGAIWCGPLKEPWRGLKCWCFMEGGGWSIGLGGGLEDEIFGVGKIIFFEIP